MARPVPVDSAAPLPEVSVVVTVFDEAGSLEELYRRATAALEGRDYELIFVDDGSTDGSFELVERFHAADARVHGVKLKRNFGQHPAMHAGLVRARGEIVVTMDSDLQNPPEDLPKLIGAVESGYDVASGRRAARRDSWGRTLPVASDQRDAAPLHPRRHLRLRLRLQRVPARCSRAGARRDRQAEVHEGARALDRCERRRGRRRPCRARRLVPLLAAPARPHRPERPGRLLAAADPVDRPRARRDLHARRGRPRLLRGSRTGSTTRTSPAPCSAAWRSCSSSASRASSSPWSASTWAASSATSRAGRCTRSTASSSSEPRSRFAITSRP